MRAKMFLLAISVAVFSPAVRAADQPSDDAPKNKMITKTFSVEELIKRDDGTTANAEVSAAKAAKLLKLIIGAVRPYSWQDMGGPGKVEYYDVGKVVVVNNSPAAVQEVDDFLAALRTQKSQIIAQTHRLGEVLKAYQKACAEGRMQEALQFAVQALAIDPMCFAENKSSK